MIIDNLFEKVLVEPAKKGADTLYVISGYASNALAIATTMPLSLNEPVGLHPSSLKYSSPQPISLPSSLHLTNGVSPSP
ncbi:unnamed protein product, partial [marine sediment metagenome]